VSGSDPELERAVLVGLASYRLTHLLVRDDVMRPMRAWVSDRALGLTIRSTTTDDDRPYVRRQYVEPGPASWSGSELVTAGWSYVQRALSCELCTGWWVTGLLVALSRPRGARAMAWRWAAAAGVQASLVWLGRQAMAAEMSQDELQRIAHATTQRSMQESLRDLGRGAG